MSQSIYSQPPPVDFDLSSYEYRRRKLPPTLPKELKDKLEVSDAEKNEYKKLTKDSKGKFAKIWNDPCEQDKIIDSTDSYCISQLKFAPGSRYLFPNRTTYKVAASIHSIKGEFRAKKYDQTIQFLVDLGELDLSRIDKKTESVSSLGRLPITGDKDPVDLTGIEEGRRFENLVVSDRRPIAVNHSYLLRSVDNGYWRTETTYAFRVVKFDNNIVTIAWKELDSKLTKAKAVDKP